MTAWPKLDALDQAHADVHHFRLVEELKLVPGGVDPLGLRQVNLDLMATALPGINNVTYRIRPYAFMAWAWWRAAQTFMAGNNQVVQASRLQNLVDRWEVVFAWSHVLASNTPELPGRNVLSASLPRALTPYRLHGKSWDEFRDNRRSSTALMAAIQYGPSIKSLGWLIPQQGRTFVPSDQAIPAVVAIDAIAKSALPADMLLPSDVAITPEQARALHAAWNVAEPSEAEKQVFRRLFFDAGADPRAGHEARRRQRSLRLIQSILQQETAPLPEMTIRRALASGRLASGEDLALSADLVETQRLWAALQARQLQRIALEAMLVWIEAQIDDRDGKADAEDLAAAAASDARSTEDEADSSTVGIYLAAASSRGAATGWPAACAHEAATDIFGLMEEILSAQAERVSSVPGLALRALAFAEAMAAGLREAGIDNSPRGPLGGNADRLPLNGMSRRIEMLRGSSMRDLWREIILSWVLAQHIRWSVARNGDGTQRLRLALDEGGWVRLRADRSGPFGPTPDRLAAALSLASDCGLIAASAGGGGGPSYAAAA
jgi:hypothetical protein